MAHETPASFGAWCAVKTSLPSQNDISAVNNAKSAAEIRNVLRTLSADSSGDSVFLSESALLERYTRAVILVKRFFSPQASAVLALLAEECDWYNLLFLTKLFRSADAGASAYSFLCVPPAAAVSPPSFAQIKSLDDIASAYSRICPPRLYSDIAAGTALPEGYARFETASLIVKMMRVYTRASGLDPDDRITIFSFLYKSFDKIYPHTVKEKFPEKIIQMAETLRKNLQPLKKREAFTARDYFQRMHSPAVMYVELAEARVRIRRFCAALGRRRPYAAS